MDKRWWAGVLLAGCACAAWADGTVADVRKQAEASMLVTGTIDVDPDGSVASYAIDHREQLPAVVNNVIDRTVGNWRFQSVLEAGKPIRLKSKMSLLMVAAHADPEHFPVTVRDATFAGPDEAKGEVVTAKRIRPPHFPQLALVSGVRASVDIVVRVGRAGTVEDALVEQVNIWGVASEPEMQQLRDAFEQAVLEAAKSWTFVAPTAGGAAAEPFWTTRVPIVFNITGRAKPEYGEWHAYIPGPRRTAPWVHDPADGRDDRSLPDSQVVGTDHQLGHQLHLLTPPDKT